MPIPTSIKIPQKILFLEFILYKTSKRIIKAERIIYILVCDINSKYDN